MDKLKPCPFCGRPPLMFADNHGYVGIACENCVLLFGVVVEDANKGDELIEGWRAILKDQQSAAKLWNARKGV